MRNRTVLVTGAGRGIGRELPERLDALVSNASIGVAGPLETLSRPDMQQHQFDVNLIGPLALKVMLPTRGLDAVWSQGVEVGSGDRKFGASTTGPAAAEPAGPRGSVHSWKGVSE